MASGNACPTSSAQGRRSKVLAIDLSFRAKSGNLSLHHAHSFRHSTERHSAYWQLLWHDAAGDRLAGRRRSALLYRRLSCAHQPARSDRFTRKQPASGARFPRLRIEPRKGGAFFTKRCATGDRAGLDSFDRNASLTTRSEERRVGKDWS